MSNQVSALRQVKPEKTCFTTLKSASFLVARRRGAGVKSGKEAVKSKFIFGAEATGAEEFRVNK